MSKQSAVGMAGNTLFKTVLTPRTTPQNPAQPHL